MSRRPSVPSYGLHKASGKARVTIAGRTIYLGKYGSPESHEQYAREIAGIAAASKARTRLLLTSADRADLTIDELMLRYLQWTDAYTGLTAGRYYYLQAPSYGADLVTSGLYQANADGEFRMSVAAGMKRTPTANIRTPRACWTA